jgi:hypothetical protein
MQVQHSLELGLECLRRIFISDIGGYGFGVKIGSLARDPCNDLAKMQCQEGSDNLDEFE